MEPPPERWFHWPVGRSAEERAGPELPRAWYVATAFAEPYLPRPGHPAVHPGIDLNLRSGGDSDLGEPVFAAADGIVVASGSYRIWGNIVVLEHTTPEGQRLWTQYAHLLERQVAVGEVLPRGAPPGSVGKGERGRFTAHLHFELRLAELAPQAWPGADRRRVLRDYVDPLIALRSGLAAARQAARELAAATAAAPQVGPAGAERRARRSWSPPPRGVLRLPRGKGLFSERLWSVDGGDPGSLAREARALDLDHLVLKLAHGGKTWPCNGTAERCARSVATLRGAGLEIWGWGLATGQDPDSELGLAKEGILGLALAGWLVEPLSGRAAAAWAERLPRLRKLCPGNTVGMIAPPGLGPCRGWTDLARGVDLIVPRVRSAGELGMALAAWAPFGRPLLLALSMPAFLAPRNADRGSTGAYPAPDEVEAQGARTQALLHSARLGGCEGLAFASWEDCRRDLPGRVALATLARFDWPARRVAHRPRVPSSPAIKGA